MFLFFFLSLTEITRFSTWCNGISTGDCEAELQQTDNEFSFSHIGEKDYSVTSPRISCQPGDEVTVTGDVFYIKGDAKFQIIPYDFNNDPDWSFQSYPVVDSPGGYATYTRKWIIPGNSRNFTFRFVGSNITNFKFKSIKWDITGHYDAPTIRNVELENSNIKLTYDTLLLNMTIHDKTTQRTWTQRRQTIGGTTINLKTTSSSISIDTITQDNLIHFNIELLEDGFRSTVALDNNNSEILPPDYPFPFISSLGDRIVLPYCEGITLPVDLTELLGRDEFYYSIYSLSMAFVGQTNDLSSMIIIFETPYDSSVAVVRYNEEYLYIKPRFSLEKGRFSYPRKLRYVFLEGNHVSIAKRYRKYAQEKGYLVPFTEKIKTRPNVDKLIGAVNVWTVGSFNINKIKLYTEMQSLGIERILSSGGGSISEVNYMNNNMTNILSSRYDIYQDQMDPENIIKGYVSNSTAYFYDAFPDDVIVDENNQIITSWSVNNLSCPACSTLEECPRVGCAVLCDLRAPEYAKKKLDKEISSGYNFTTRFIDTTFASPYRECYHPDHPMTRTMSLEARIELLKEYTNRGFVVGTENGKEQAIPNCDFFEGMMSPGEYRVPNSGRDLETVFTYVPEETQYMVDETLRIPLFELVYHDCVISYWYWGDHNSKVIPQWDKRDLFNRLYGTPPMFLFNQTIWERYKNRFVQSYKTAEEISYLTGYYEMSDHKYLSDDWKVQQTVFGNNRVIVTVNFGDKKFGGIEPMSSTVIVYTDAPPWAIAVIVIAAVVIDGITFLVLFIMNRKKGEEKDSNED